MLGARDRALARERELYEALLDHADRCAARAAIDGGRARRARRARPISPSAPIALRLAQPELTDESCIEIRGGRHLVVEQHIDGPFVPNDLVLHDDRRMLIVTGPNMGGKSTYMRQAALIVILAGIGSYVPAESARIGPIDRVFTRIGAADDLAGGRSTFMVEMTEAANILNNATRDSLVLMDEIGRGTSTYDGLSLAWACARHLGPRNRRVHAVRDALLRADGAGRRTCRPVPTSTSTPPSTATSWCSCTPSRKDRPTRATACRWRAWPACRKPVVGGGPPVPAGIGATRTRQQATRAPTGPGPRSAARTNRNPCCGGCWRASTPNR